MMMFHNPISGIVYAHKGDAQAFLDSSELGAAYTVVPCETTAGWQVTLRHELIVAAPMEEDVLDEAKRLTSPEQGRDYGHPLDNFTQIAHLWNEYLGANITVRQVAWMMILMKCSRDAHSPKRDNLVDAAGYARCVQLAEDEEKRRTS